MMISDRVSKLLEGTSAIMQGHLLCSTSPFGPENLEGYLNFGIAENHLMEDWTLPLMDKKILMNPADLQYFELSGIESLRQSFVDFADQSLNIKGLHKDNVVVMNGVSSICEALSFSMFNAGDYIMVPAPYYTGFEFDFQKRFDVNFLRAYLKAENKFEHRIEDFVEAYEKFDQKNKVRAILITHPHNPTGEILSAEFLNQIVSFAKDKGLEIISDEIYALTHFKNSKHQSLWSFAEGYKDHVHVLYGLAKDFTLAGMKVGFLYSENQSLISALKLLAYFYCTSSLTQRFTEQLLKDKKFIDSFMQENNKRLSDTKSKILNSLSQFKIIHGESGLFFLLDLRDFMQDATKVSEKNLFNDLLNNHRIFLTAGTDMGMETPGFFRLCFSKKADQVDELIRRLKKFINSNLTR